MEPHDLLTLSATKAVEYLVALVSWLLFIPFWRYLDRTADRRKASPAPVESCRERDPAAGG